LTQRPGTSPHIPTTPTMVLLKQKPMQIWTLTRHTSTLHVPMKCWQHCTHPHNGKMQPCE
jgi:hypothetical protein